LIHHPRTDGLRVEETIAMSERTADPGDSELQRIFEEIVGDSVVTTRQDSGGNKGVIDATTEDDVPRTGTAGAPRKDPLADAISAPDADPEPE
jgi:hypothetical protein